MLQGEKPRLGDSHQNLNAKDPKLREQFMKHVGGDDGIGVLEDKNINVCTCVSLRQ